MSSKSEPTLPTARFSVVADAHPGMLPRVLELFAKRDLVPSRCAVEVVGQEMVIDLEMPGMNPSTADYVGRCMKQIFGVVGVAVSSMSPAHRSAARRRAA